MILYDFYSGFWLAGAFDFVHHWLLFKMSDGDGVGGGPLVRVRVRVWAWFRAVHLPFILF